MYELELFPHNEDGYQKLVNSLEDNNFSFLERATGTGKTYILIKYLAMKMRGKRILFVTTHEPMYQQLVTQDMPNLNISKDIFNKFDFVLYSSINKKSAQWYFDNYDCFVFDEAHHCGAPIWSIVISELRDLVRASSDKKMIGASATSIRYLDKYTDVAEVYFDNNVCSKLNLTSAILQGILPVPFYVNVCDRISIDLEGIRRKLTSIGDLNELKPIRKKIEQVSKDYDFVQDVNNLFKEYNVTLGEKYIVFCSSIEDMNNRIKEANFWFKDIGNIDVYKVYYKMSKNGVAKEIQKFTINDPNKIKLMFAVDMFSEGMHIPGVDGIIMTRRTTSPGLYLQQIGRCLSFSARKKQIKIFDLVGNASGINVIYELYKELLLEAEKEIEFNPKNKEFFENIINKFQIIYTNNELIEYINEVDEYLDNNYILKNKIEKFTLVLEDFVSSTKCDFMDLVKNNKLDSDYKNIYGFLCKKKNYLTVDVLIKLHELGIYVAEWHKDSDVLDQIKTFGSYSRVINNEIKKLFEEYNNFYLDNNRRPLFTNFDEAELANKYRYYLTIYKSNKIKKFLFDVSYPLNIEEDFIVGHYPNIKKINEYLDLIEKKYYEGIIIDKLELRTLNKIGSVLNISDRPVIKDLIYGKSLKIDNCINIIKKNVVDNYEDGHFISIDLLKLNNDSYSSYMYILKNYKYVTNFQFQIILDMNLELIGSLDSTIEKRNEDLKGCNSYYDLECLTNRRSVKKIIDFIESNGRRPDINNDSEILLASSYNKFLKTGNKSFIKKVCDCLLHNNIALSFEEKVILGEKLNFNEMNNLYNDILSTIRNCDSDSFNLGYEKRKIEYLYNNNKIDYRLSRFLNRSILFMDKVFKYNDDILCDLKYFKQDVWNHKDVISPKLIHYIEDIGVKLPSVFVDQINSKSSKFVNLAFVKYNKEMKLYYEFFDYIKKYKCRPQDEVLVNYISKYLIESNLSDRKLYLNRLNSLGVDALPSELAICDILSDKSKNELFNSLSDQVNNGKELGILDNYVYNKLLLKVIFSDSHSGKKNNFVHLSRNDASKSFIEYMKSIIKDNPFDELDFDGDLSILSKSEKQELVDYRLDLIGPKFLEDVLNDVKTNEDCVENVLSENDLKLYNDIVTYNLKNHKFDVILSKINELNKINLFKSKRIVLDEFIDEYISFIRDNGRLPDLGSGDILENEIAMKFDIIYSVSDTKERKKLLSIGKKEINDKMFLDFYTKLIEFINSNERFPCVLSEDNDEIELANIYKKDNAKLSKEQSKNIAVLQKKYQANTIKFYAERKGK